MPPLCLDPEEAALPDTPVSLSVCMSVPNLQESLAHHE